MFLPNLVLAVLLAGVTAALCRGWRSLAPRLADGSQVAARALVLPTLALVAAGIGTCIPTQHALSALANPISAAYTGGPDLIGDGGLQAAAWLEHHSHIHDVVATNAHCQFPTDSLAAHCKTENFWMAGYSERQFLVEGWAYVTRASVGLPSLADENINSAPFWDPTRLALNDATFQSPSTATLDNLKERYGVKWLFVDQRYQVNYPALLKLGSLAPLVYSAGSYAIFEVK
ncbi:MAG TPA: hypothetical protein VN108_03745 [Marmoricola sp.]|nr:hypothetical protein [Marmoricola sp.]